MGSDLRDNNHRIVVLSFKPESFVKQLITIQENQLRD